MTILTIVIHSKQSNAVQSMPFHALLPILTSLLYLILLTTAAPTNGTNTNTPSPSPSPSFFAATNLTEGAGPHCFNNPRFHPAVDSFACLEAIVSPSTLKPAEYITPRGWSTFSSDPSKVRVPISMGGDNNCRMVVGSEVKSELTFSILGASYFASLVYDDCVRGQKVPLGGRWRFTNAPGFFVDLVGGEGPDLEWVDGVGAVVDGSLTL